ncbi:glycine betaine ABC transporter substrate-binding protein [Amycolatopsis suaedae]|uniref:Glycine betaine ABC transporter substrate-binding protein n=1 Tax=Amycolatopsis suaedae TaxID=2510978 RepID=A0A4Q7J516_9PSEU|nr:glycine betaine ABC transporter substrate-binding protein [Amycolatopsis suaedae]RZQ62159.1 glycine betaine ABC transporter substrate-binding protein [Amycolatopsis suaedae]
MRRRMKAVLGAALLAATVSGCGLETNAALPYEVGPGSIKAIPELQGVDITVGSKDFTENILLGYIAELALAAAGADVSDLTDIKGSVNARKALLSGDVDLTWEYTGTGWINYQGNTDPIPDEREQFEAVKKADAEQFGVAWLEYSPVNNTYAFATTAAYAQQHNLKTNSDMTRFLKENPDQAVFCLETEFSSRQDGFPGVQKVYGFPSTDIKQFGTGAIYTSVASGTCNFGEVFTTDGRIAGLNLKVLEDDKKFFPQYNASPTLRVDFLNQHPRIREVLAPVSAALSNDQMIEMGKQVDIDGKDPSEVAKDWMVAKGFVTVS